MAKTVLLIPGWNEKAHDLRTITHGRPPLPGLAARGFEPLTFEVATESLPERIDRFAEFIRSLKKTEPARFPAVILGYSMGGIVARGLLRRHPELAADISHVALLATPNWGLRLAVIPAIARIIGLPWRELYNIDPEHEFVPWLNGCAGRWKRVRGKRVWQTDADPWVAPPGVRLLAIAGVVPRFKDGDGLVSVDSATMGGRIPSVTITDPHANHLNVTGETDLAATLTRGFQRSDGVWPQVLDAFCSFVGGPDATPAGRTAAAHGALSANA
ncbi:MAG: hypothetical protein NVS3B28_01020 [Candidatus Velthaea sp.]